MSLNDLEGFERANPIQRIVGFIASFVCCGAVIMYFFGSISTKQLTNILLLWGLFGFFLYWLIGKLPYFLSSAFNTIFAFFREVLNWIILFSAYAAGRTYRAGKMWKKPSKPNYPKWIFVTGIVLISSAAISWLTSYLIGLCIFTTQNKSYLCAFLLSDVIYPIFAILTTASYYILPNFNFLKLIFIGACLLVISKRMGKKQKAKQENIDPSFGEEEPIEDEPEEPSGADDEYSHRAEEQPDQDPMGDWRFTNAKAKNRYKSQNRKCIEGETDSIRRMAKQWVLDADAGLKIHNGIKAYKGKDR